MTLPKTLINFLKQSLLITAGSLLFAFAVKALIVPQGLLAGGMTGFALLIFYKWPILPLGLIYFMVNAPIFVLGWKFVGRRFVAYSLWGLVIYSAALSAITMEVELVDPLLAAFIAAALTGTGTAIILRSQGSSGGADVLCVVLHKRFSLTLGSGSILLNAFLLSFSATLLPAEIVLYSTLYIVVAAQFTDRIFKSMNTRRAVLIISSKWEALIETLNANRIGVTLLRGDGGFQREEQTILYSITAGSRVSHLKRLVTEMDAAAFISVMVADDVTGVEVGNQPHW